MDITSVNNNLIKEIKKLYKKRDRIKMGLFIVEGIKMIQEVLDNDYYLEHILYSEKLLSVKNGKDLYETLEGMEISKKVTAEVFNEISDTENPQGVIGISKLKLNDIKSINIEKSSKLIYLDGLQDPGNMGTIIRTADAFNMDGVIIKSGTVDPYNPKVVRSSMGSIFRVPIYYSNSLNEDIDYLKQEGYRFLVTNLEESKDIKEIDFKRSIIVIGNESVGVSRKILEESDQLIKINMPGKSESLNAGVAASIIMYEASKSIG